MAQQVALVRHGPAHVPVVMVMPHQALPVEVMAVAVAIVMVQEALQLTGDMLVELPPTPVVAAQEVPVVAVPEASVEVQWEQVQDQNVPADPE